MGSVALLGATVMPPLALPVVPPTSRSAQTVAHNRVLEVLDRFADAYLRDSCRAGISIVARIDGATYFSNRGFADRSLRTAPTPDSVYELASVSKTFAGAIAARALVERRVTLDADFRLYLPGDYSNLVASGVPITLRTLATHTAGLQRDLPDSDPLLAKIDYDRIGYQLTELNRGYTRKQSLADLGRVRLRTVPGASFAYSNLGIRVLGYGLETVYGTSFERLLRRSILNPLRMTSTSLKVSPAMRARLVVPYGRSGKVQPLHDSSAGAAYGLYSTPRDMGRYLAWQLNERDPSIARAHERIRGTVDDAQGLIWNIGRADGQRMLWHGGGSFGETSQMVMFPDRRLGFVLLANDSCEGSEAAMKALAISVGGGLSTRRPRPLISQR